jgi:hypothetical protein
MKKTNIRERKMTAKKNSSQGEVEARIQECIHFIATESISYTDWTIYVDQKYGKVARTAQRYWDEAWKRIREKYQDRTEELTGQALLKIDNLYKQIEQAGGDWQSRTNLLKERSRLMGLGRTNISVQGDVKISFGFEDLNEEEEL